MTNALCLQKLSADDKSPTNKEWVKLKKKKTHTANKDGSGKTAQMCRLSWALADSRCLFGYIPVNNLSVMVGRVFLGWISTKQRIMYHISNVISTKFWCDGSFVVSNVRDFEIKANIDKTIQVRKTMYALILYKFKYHLWMGKHKYWRE